MLIPEVAARDVASRAWVDGGGGSGRDVRVVPVLEVGTDRVERLTELRLVARAHSAPLAQRVRPERITGPDLDILLSRENKQDYILL